MYDKVTEKYEKDGTAIYYMSLPSEEHALAILDMRDNGDLVIQKTDIASNLDDSLIAEEGLRKILDRYSPSIKYVNFDVIYKSQLSITTTVDYLKRIITITVDPNITEEQRKLLSEYFLAVMGYYEAKEHIDPEYGEFKNRFALICKLIACISIALVPIFGPFAIIICIVAYVLTMPKVIEEIYEYYKKNR